MGTGPLVADLLGRGYNVAHQKDREAGEDDVEPGQGASIASRWPLGDVREVDLNVTPRTSDFACAALVAEILAPKPVGPMLFVNHRPNWQLNFELERELQAVAVARFVEEMVGLRGRHVVLAGDLTADADSGSVRFFSGRQSLEGTSVCYRDAWIASIPAIRATPSRPAIP